MNENIADFWKRTSLAAATVAAAALGSMLLYRRATFHVFDGSEMVLPAGETLLFYVGFTLAVMLVLGTGLARLALLDEDDSLMARAALAGSTLTLLAAGAVLGICIQSATDIAVAAQPDPTPIDPIARAFAGAEVQYLFED